MHTQVHECWDMHVQTTWQYARAHCIRTPRLKGRQDPREHKTSSNEIQSCGHALYPIEMKLEKVQRSQLEFITGGRSTQIRARTHPPTHTHTHKENKRQLRSQSAASFAQSQARVHDHVGANRKAFLSELRSWVCIQYKSGCKKCEILPLINFPEIVETMFFFKKNIY